MYDASKANSSVWPNHFVSFLKNLHALIMRIHIHVSMSEKWKKASKRPLWAKKWHWSVSHVWNVIFHISAMTVQHYSVPPSDIHLQCIFNCSQGFFLCLPMNILPWLGVNGITNVYYGPTWQSVLLIEVFPSEMSKCFYLCHVVHYNISK